MAIEISGGTFEEAQHIYRDAQGMRVLSVTQILAFLGLVVYGFIRQEVLERKSKIGIAVHAAVQYLCEQTLDWNTVAQEAIGYVVGAEQWIRDNGFHSVSREERGICEIHCMKFGFQYDHRGYMLYKGRIRQTIVDLKTCTQESASWRLQTAAYALASPALPNGEKYLRVVLQLFPDGRVKPFYFDDPEDEKAFLYFLFCAIWKQNHGYALEAA